MVRQVHVREPELLRQCSGDLPFAHELEPDQNGAKPLACPRLLGKRDLQVPIGDQTGPEQTITDFSAHVLAFPRESALSAARAPFRGPIQAPDAGRTRVNE